MTPKENRGALLTDAWIAATLFAAPITGTKVAKSLLELLRKIKRDIIRKMNTGIRSKRI
jgi:hypothetical protein